MGIYYVDLATGSVAGVLPYLASFHSDFDASEPWKLLYLAAGVGLPLLLSALWRRLMVAISKAR